MELKAMVNAPRGSLAESSGEPGCTTNEGIPSRRVVLQGALAAGCGLWATLALSGCDARKGADSPTAAPAQGAGASAGSAGTSPAPGKVTQASVQYQQQPKGEQKCSACTHFIADSKTCKLVEGQINPEGWCVLWVKLS